MNKLEILASMLEACGIKYSLTGPHDCGAFTLCITENGEYIELQFKDGEYQAYGAKDMTINTANGSTLTILRGHDENRS